MPIEIIEYIPKYKEDIKILNIEWLSKYFTVEPIDMLQLSNPQVEIIDKGGIIYYAIIDQKVIGTATLMKMEDSNYELGKMAVTEKHQGAGIGKKLLIHCINKAKDLNLNKLILYSNTQLTSAIQMYSKFGFIEKEMDKPHYKRANIKMELDLMGNITFDFETDYILENESILLRPLEISDYTYLEEYSINEPEIWYYNAGGADSPEKLRKYIEIAVNNRKNKLDYAFIVYDKNKKKYVGTSRFYDMQIPSKNIQLGFTWYCKSVQGTSINKQCKYLLLQFAFEKIDLERVGFRASHLNERSINAMKSIGCTVEGFLRSFAIDSEGKRQDAIVLSILKNEWFSEIKEKLNQKINAIKLKDSSKS